MQFYEHEYDHHVLEEIDRHGNNNAPPAAWVNKFRELGDVYGPQKADGPWIEPTYLADEHLSDDQIFHLLCTKPGAFTGVMELPDDLIRKYAAAKAYEAQLLEGQIQRGPNYEMVHHNGRDRWTCPSPDVFVLFGSGDHKLPGPTPANIQLRNSDYLFADSMKYFAEYVTKKVTWQEAYALYFEFNEMEPLKENIPKYLGEDTRLLMANYLWFKRNKPTYRLWPEWTRTFTQSRMVEFPTNLYVQPYTSLVIILPVTSPAPLTYDNRPVRSIQLTTFNNDSFRGTAFKGQHLDDEHHMMHLYACVDQRESPDEELEYNSISIIPEVQCTLPLNTDLSLVEQLERYDLPQDYKDIWSVALSVAYLGTCQYKLIEPDIINKDIPRYLKALEEGDLSRISQLHAKATRVRHHISFNVGRNTDAIIRILGKTSKNKSHDNGKPKRELNFRHIRRFHFRHINQGKGAPKEKVIPMMEIIVRPDKPDKEWYNINFRSLDDEGK